MFLFVRDTVAAGRDDDLRVKDHNRTIWELTRCGRATPIDSKNAKRRLRAIDRAPSFSRSGTFFDPGRRGGPALDLTGVGGWWPALR